VAELDRIAQTVDFNGTKLLDGTFTSKELQVGAYASTSQKISVDVLSTRATAIGSPFEITGTEAATGGFTQGQATITVNNRNFFAATPTQPDRPSPTPRRSTRPPARPA